MQSADRAKLYEALGNLSELYGKPLSDGAMGLWFEALHRFELSAITRALTRHVNDPDSGQFFPKPADVVRHIEGGKLDRAAQSWTKVDKAIRHVGPYQTICFDDPIIQRVVSDMGGWIELCMTSEDDYPYRENEFKKRYQGYVLHPPQRYPAQLQGIAQTHNESQGHAVAPPLLLGDPKVAQRVMSAGASGPGLQISVGELLPVPESLIEDKVA